MGKELWAHRNHADDEFEGFVRRHNNLDRNIRYVEGIIHMKNSKFRTSRRYFSDKETNNNQVSYKVQLSKIGIFLFFFFFRINLLIL